MNSRISFRISVPDALILLSLIPVVAGMVRLTRLARGVAVTPENSRFFASPQPVIIHILSASIFCIIGAFQFAPDFRKRNPRWHRIAGRILIVSGILAALSGIWMTQFYPLKPDLQGDLLFGLRYAFGSAMVLFIMLSFLAIRKGDVSQHKAWILRGYAIGQGAGTQALILLPWTFIVGTPDIITYEMLMGLGWVINSVVAERIIKTSNLDSKVLLN